MRLQTFFWMKFNSEQLLMEAFFDAMRIFGYIQPKVKYCHYYTADTSNYADGAHI